jgi:signal transduction histidine kinase
MSWRRMHVGHRSNLQRQFVIASALTISLCMVLLAFFISRQLEKSMMDTAADEGAILLDVFLGSSLQELATSTQLSPGATDKLDALLTTTMGDRTKALKVWLRDGTLVYAKDKRFVGQKFPSTELDEGFKGEPFGSFADTNDHAHEAEKDFEKPLVEIYAPIYRTGTRDIIAVGELYNSGARLTRELSSMRWTAAAIVGAVTAPMMAILFLMVSRAGAIVRKNRVSLRRKIQEARALLLQNDQLRRTTEAVQLDAMHSNEKLLGQIGQDLHDGPVQLVSVLALKLSELVDAIPTTGRIEPTASVTDLTAAILKELRDISSGMVLPELNNLNGTETLYLAVQYHQRKTGTSVACKIHSLSFQPDPILQVCMFRVVQECLNNAYAHGDGHAQRVTVFESLSGVTIVVSNASRSEAKRAPATGTGLGLLGLRRRVTALGGSIDVRQLSNVMRVTVKLPKHAPRTEIANHKFSNDEIHL